MCTWIRPRALNTRLVCGAKSAPSARVSPISNYSPIVRSRHTRKPAPGKRNIPGRKQAVQTLSDGIDVIFGKIADGGSLDMVTVKKSIEPMLESIVRHPGCVYLAGAAEAGRSVRLPAPPWCVDLGSGAGSANGALPKADLRTLAIGGLLFDVGKLGVPKELLDSSEPLSDAQFQQVRDHVKLGVETIKGSAVDEPET